MTNLDSLEKNSIDDVCGNKKFVSYKIEPKKLEIPFHQKDDDDWEEFNK